jgi:hypothetical protein
MRSAPARVFACVLLVALSGSNAAWAGEMRLPFSIYRLPTVSDITEGGDSRDMRAVEDAGEAEEGGDSETGKKVAGAIMLGSGILLCSWGIVDWQTADTQCCPARNTENVAKLVVGVVLVNAGLVYLIAGGL